MSQSSDHGEDRQIESTRLLLEKILRTLVTSPEAVIVQVSRKSDAVVFTVRADQVDLNNIVG